MIKLIITPNIRNIIKIGIEIKEICFGIDQNLSAANYQL